MTTLTTPSRFDQLEAEIAKLPPVDAEVVHHFSKGVYARELRLPAGAALTGKTHKHACLNIVVGDITVWNVADGTQTRIIGHACFESPAGTHRAGLTHRPTIWTTVHVTEETDLAKIEAEVIEEYTNPLLQTVHGRII